MPDKSGTDKGGKAKLPAKIENNLPAMDGDEEAYKEWKRKNAFLKFRHSKLIWLAAKQGQVEATRYLLSKGNPLSPYVHIAIAYKSLNAAKTFIKAGANIETRGKKHCDSQALYLSIQNGYDEITDMLLEAGADVNFNTHNTGVGDSVWAAISNGKTKILEKLFEAGVDTKNLNGTARCVMSAAQSGYIETLKLLLDKNIELVTGEEKYQTIHAASYHGQIEVIKMLLKEDPKVINLPDESGRTPLYMAVWGGHKPTIEFLAAHGADTSVGCPATGKALSSKAAEWGHGNDVISLLVKPSEVKEKSVDGWSVNSNKGFETVIKTTTDNKTGITIRHIFDFSARSVLTKIDEVGKPSAMTDKKFDDVEPTFLEEATDMLKGTKRVNESTEPKLV